MKKTVILLGLGLAFLAIFLTGNYLPVNAQDEEQDGGVIDHIGITPVEVFLEKGHGQQFTAKAYDADGNIVAFEPVWATTGGTITQDGFYTASQGGCHQVFAIDEKSGISAEATVVVTCGDEGETCLAVIPSRVTLHVGDQIQFSVFEKTSEGVGKTVECGWYTSGGTITHSGMFTAEQVGSYTITAVEMESGRMGSAHVVVEELHVLPWWAYTMMGGEWFWAMGLLLGLVAGLVVYLYRRSRSPKNPNLERG